MISVIESELEGTYQCKSVELSVMIGLCKTGSGDGIKNEHNHRFIKAFMVIS